MPIREVPSSRPIFRIADGRQVKNRGCGVLPSPLASCRDLNLVTNSAQSFDVVAQRDVFPVLDAILKRELVQRHLQDYSVNSGVLVARDPPRSRIGAGRFSVLRFGDELDRKYRAFHRERKPSRLDSPRAVRNDVGTLSPVPSYGSQAAPS